MPPLPAHAVRLPLPIRVIPGDFARDTLARASAVWDEALVRNLDGLAYHTRIGIRT